MAMRISVGGESFDELRQNGAYYVDKTEFAGTAGKFLPVWTSQSMRTSAGSG